MSLTTLTPEQFAQIKGVGAPAVRSWIRKGWLQARLGRRPESRQWTYMISAAAMDDFDRCYETGGGTNRVYYRSRKRRQGGTWR